MEFGWAGRKLFKAAAKGLGASDVGERRGAVSALEDLGQGDPRFRQHVVDVLADYLRSSGPGVREMSNKLIDLSVAERFDPVELRLDYEVRAAAQGVLTRHVRPRDPARFWPGLSLHLQFTDLVDVDLSGCHVDYLLADRTVVHGYFRCDDAVFDHCAYFDGAVFEGEARFERVTVKDAFDFADAAFAARADFTGSEVGGHADFSEAGFGSSATFDDVVFAGGSWFNEAKAAGPVSFARTSFRGETELSDAEFSGPVSFAGAVFDAVDVSDARFAGPVVVEGADFGRAADFRGVRFDHGDPFIAQRP
ncbi:pentapeptide repeat-containing protein [Actinokineospora inagensis]|uniref:pentapeptide repeat-containing protein n=1 Tax=Actinokineospora inagensis TaxID=103730 RepID=UPI0004794028|nr:pentapeptide repeat-containing protein [Actinokineospora inagensis]